MSRKDTGKFLIKGTPRTSGLDLSAARNTVDETQLWELEGLYATPNHTWEKRPEFVQWGTQLIEPTYPDPTNDELVSKIITVDDQWTDVVKTGDSTLITFDNGSLVLSGWDSDDGPGGTPGESTTTRPVISPEEYNAAAGHDSDVFFSFIVQAKDTSAGVYATIRFAVEENVQKEISITSGGLGIRTGVGTWLTVANTSNLVDGLPHRVDIYSVGGIAYDVYVDGTQAASGVWSYYENTSDTFIEVSAVSDATLPSEPYSIRLSAFILRDTTTAPFFETEVSDLATVRDLRAASFVDTFSLLAASGGYLWIDYALREVWAPLAPMPRELTRFSKFRGNTIICNYADNSRSTEVYEYDGSSVNKLDQAPDIRFSTEYANRIWGAGDVNHPLRVYFCGDRQSNLWYNPDDPNIANTLDAEEDAGFIEFPGDDKARVRLVYGDSFGMLLVVTDTDVWMITGSSPRDFVKRRLTGAISAAGDLCGTDVYNDYWVLGRHGVASIQTTDKYGDIQGSKVSSLARELFDTDNPSGRMLDTSFLHKSKMVYYPKSNTMLFHSFESGEDEPGVIYAYNAETQKWSGPWREECSAMRVVTLAWPVKDMVVVGTSDGYVKYMTQHVSNADTFKMSSAWIDGRSVDPNISSMEKTWDRLRLVIAPTGNWDITIKWKTEDKAWNSKTEKLYIPNKHPLIGDDATTGDSLAKTTIQPYMIEVPLRERGVGLKWEITGTAPRIKVLEWGVNYSVSGHEKE